MLLEDALQLVTLYGEAGDPKYEAACRRYLARWIVEDSPDLADTAAPVLPPRRRRAGRGLVY